jgi:hypothetical protein
VVGSAKVKLFVNNEMDSPRTRTTKGDMEGEEIIIPRTRTTKGDMEGEEMMILWWLEKMMEYQLLLRDVYHRLMRIIL